MKPKPPTDTRPTHYDALKVARDAPAEVIRAAYRTLSQKYHPDRNADAAQSAQIMASINLAYDVLSDPDRKRDYDDVLEGKTLPVAVAPRASRLRSIRLLRASFSRRRLAVALSAAGLAAAVGAYSHSQERDPWLERAWQESWRAAPPAGPMPSQEAVVALPEAAFGATQPAGLKWEHSLRRSSATEASTELRF